MRNSSTWIAVTLACGLSLDACDFSMTGKDRCRDDADCLAGNRCTSGLCVAEGACIPQCVGRQCGDDGCGHSCGECGAGFRCDQGSGYCALCVTTSCQDRECGSDGCGRTCGTCKPWQDCNASGRCETMTIDAGSGHWDAGITGDAGDLLDAGDLADAGTDDAGLDSADAAGTGAADVGAGF